jgi:hypothetical protein
MRAIGKIIAVAALAGAGILGGTSAVDAQPRQDGLVNVNLTDLTVQVPISVAANVCDVNVAVLVNDLRDQAADCDASSTSTAGVITTDGTFPSEGPVRQQGLVNVNITDVVVQAPIGIAANICDVNVAVLVDDLRDDAANCNADATPNARITR